jgi:Tfp pilus assembly protein PilF
VRSAIIAFAVLLGACAQTAPPGLMDVASRPAEKALLAGLQSYEDGQYARAEAQLQQALQAGLASPRDRATAHKQLAFLYCTSGRTTACAGEFKLARVADPAFALTKSEAGHPLWGPVYQGLEP